MIEVGYAEFLLMILGLWIVYIAWLWLREARRINYNEWHLSNSKLFHCNKCHHSFVPGQPVSICRCPRCNTMCIKRKNDLFSDIGDE